MRGGGDKGWVQDMACSIERCANDNGVVSEARFQMEDDDDGKKW